MSTDIQEAESLEATARVLRESDRRNRSKYKTDLNFAKCFEAEAKYWRTGNASHMKKANAFRALALQEEQRDIADNGAWVDGGVP